jgi:hypothetical protein
LNNLINKSDNLLYESPIKQTNTLLDNSINENTFINNKINNNDNEDDDDDRENLDDLLKLKLALHG